MTARGVARRLVVFACLLISTDGMAEPPSAVAVVISGIARSDVGSEGGTFTATRRQIEEFEVALAGCIERAVMQRHPGVRVMMPGRFYELAFPRLTAAEAPRSLESLQVLLQDDVFRSTLLAAGVKQIVVAGGAARRSYQTGAVQPYYIGGYAAGVLWLWGSIVWDNESRLAAYVIDIERRVSAAEIQSFAKDQSSFGVHILLPTGNPSGAQEKACSDLGDRVAASLRE
jgi:hypothetical protein